MLFAKLLPREGNYFALFEEHGSRIAEGARAFVSMIEHYDDLAERARHAGALDAAERQADRVTDEVNRLLHKTFVTPIDREQIHGLINTMDDVLDLMQNASQTLQLYDVREVDAEVLRLAELSQRCCQRVADVVKLLPRLSEASIVDAALKTCREIDELESDADRVMRAAMSRLFREQADVRELIKQKAVYELLEEITDRCEDVAKLIEGIVLENS